MYFEWKIASWIEQEAAEAHGISAMPTFKFFLDGKEVFLLTLVHI